MDRIRKILITFSEIVEVVLAVTVAVLLVMDIIGLIPKIAGFWSVRGETEEFSKLLSSVLSIVVGTEFIKMLIKPTFSNVTEVLVFLIARHVILSEATPIDNLISVISIAILFLLEHLLKADNTGNISEDGGLLGDLPRRWSHRIKNQKSDNDNEERT